MARKRELSSETQQSILVLRNDGYSMREIAKKLMISYNGVWELLLEAWGAISPDYLNKLTARMPKVCNAVIAANEGFFDESKV